MTSWTPGGAAALVGDTLLPVVSETMFVLVVMTVPQPRPVIWYCTTMVSPVRADWKVGPTGRISQLITARAGWAQRTSSSANTGRSRRPRADGPDMDASWGVATLAFPCACVNGGCPGV